MIVVYFICSLIFSIIFYINTILLLFITWFCNIFRVKKISEKISKIWTGTTIVMLKYICGVKYKVEGIENIPNDKNFIIVSKHQSTWETYFLYSYFKGCLACVVKKELLKIPGMGTSLKSVGCIAIDRNGGANALKKMLQDSKYYALEKKRSLLIFPQGTRVLPDSKVEDYPYKSGFVAIALATKLDLLPISLNSGISWPKGSFIKKPATITVKIDKLIKYEEYSKLDKIAIAKMIENVIESNQKLLKD